jgi:low temperature requirement protein LtrA
LLTRASRPNLEKVSTVAIIQAAGRIENSMVIPGNLAVILFGVILALVMGAPIFGFLQGASQNWLLVSNVLLVIMLSAVPLVFVPRGKKFGAVLEEALAEGRMTPELRAEMDDKLVQVVHMAEIIGVMIIVVLMVFKPF